MLSRQITVSYERLSNVYSISAQDGITSTRHRFIGEQFEQAMEAFEFCIKHSLVPVSTDLTQDLHDAFLDVSCRISQLQLEMDLQVRQPTTPYLILKRLFGRVA